MRQPRRDRPGDKAHQAVHNELNNPAVRTPRAVEQLGQDERDRADDHEPDAPANSFDVEKNIIHRAEHQRRQDAEQITVLQRPGEHREQLCRLRNAGRMAPIAGHYGGRQQHPEPAERRRQRCENQIPFHAPPRGFCPVGSFAIAGIASTACADPNPRPPGRVGGVFSIPATPAATHPAPQQRMSRRCRSVKVYGDDKEYQVIH